MELKINMIELNDLIKTFIDDTYCYDYRNDDLRINENLNDYFKYLLNTKKDEFLTYLKENKVVCNVKEFTLKFIIIKDSIIELDTAFSLDRNYGENDDNKFNCKIIVTPKDDKYEIKDIRLSTIEGNTNYGFHLVDLLKKRLRIAKPQGNKITLALTVRNEADKFIRRMLTHAMKYVSNIVILDDASTDNTIDVCEEVLIDFPHKIYKNHEPMMMNLKESESKKKLWDLTIKENPDWILLLDADELFEDWGTEVLPTIVNDPNFDAYYFKIYHMWEDDYHYRVDGLWAPVDYRIYLLRYQPNFEYTWSDMGLHCYRHPYNAYEMPGCFCYVRLRHYGHFTKEIRNAKFKRYRLLDPNSEFVPKSHYDSILEDNPTLEKF